MDKLSIIIKSKNGFKIGDQFIIIGPMKEGDVITHTCLGFITIIRGGENIISINVLEQL